MSHRIKIKKHHIEKDLKYNNYIIGLFINRIIKKGKKHLAQNIMYKTLDLLKNKTNIDPLQTIEQAVRNASPYVKLMPKRAGGATYRIPTLLSSYQATKNGISWIIYYANLRSGNSIENKLMNEILETAKGVSSTIKKRDEVHKMAESNKVYLSNE